MRVRVKGCNWFICSGVIQPKARKRVEAFVSLFLILLARHDEGSTHPMQGIYYRACVDGAHTGAGKSLHRKALHGKARHGLARK